ncbi:hypothetical protein LTR78_005123 [Recurvomyces mirabilis]|uniref:Uncharacterized protein n=1 Tax=Recurvomyces mirabilis TaxID=574656 RepID=A0AAE0WNY5_9PEZI|nr:hypothetical protein LTR78_005123 [Recurvomyces mirabilis]KAK5158263.1 hypothetical protein LTS14_003281 [Recurvomyces mirabilis]
MVTQRKYIEQPDIPTDSQDLQNPTNQRTIEQQEKQDNFIAKKTRDEGGQSNHSRSQSRKARRKRIETAQRDGKYMHTNKLEALEEADANGEMGMMQPFERIGPDSTSMDGPVTMARAKRGEIPVRGVNGQQPYFLTPEEPAKSGPGGLADADGLKLTLEANLDIEIELKASIRGDLTLSL